MLPLRVIKAVSVFSFVSSGGDKQEKIKRGLTSLIVDAGQK